MTEPLTSNQSHELEARVAALELAEARRKRKKKELREADSVPHSITPEVHKFAMEFEAGIKGHERASKRMRKESELAAIRKMLRRMDPNEEEFVSGKALYEKMIEEHNNAFPESALSFNLYE